MKNFTIENETNNIMIHVSAKEADAVPNSERFSSESALAKLAANWPAARLVEFWNSLPGETPVRKLIWKALQNLGQPARGVEESAPVPEAAPVTELPETAPVPEQEARETTQPEAVIPESTEPAVATTVAPQAPDVAPQAPDVAPSEPAAKKKTTRAKRRPLPRLRGMLACREGSKTSAVIAMLKRDGGTTLEEIMAEMGWLKHTTRRCSARAAP
jgi:hypothetical protein